MHRWSIKGKMQAAFIFLMFDTSLRRLRCRKKKRSTNPIKERLTDTILELKKTAI